MSKLIDETGNTHGNLQVIRRTTSVSKKGIYWLCVCLKCNTTTAVRGDHLRSGLIAGCSSGCTQKTHGMTKSPEFMSWDSMLQRCTNENDKHYKSWGGRGITVCDRWLVFQNFLDDMYPRLENTTLDRKDNNAGYCKENCRWATRKTQMRNTRANRWVTIDGETKVLAEWLEISGTKKNRFYRRTYLGWSERDAIFGKTP